MENTGGDPCVTNGLKAPLQILFWKSSEREGSPKFSYIRTQTSQNCPFFFQSHRSAVQNFRIQEKHYKKNVSCECSERVENFPGKGLK